MWKPLHLDYILGKYDPLSFRVVSSLIIWILFIAGSIWISLANLPDDWISTSSNKSEIQIEVNEAVSQYFALRGEETTESNNETA